jgi:hypothetical protein
MVRFYWWLVALLPPLALLMALDTARTARSADEALGLSFFLAPFLLAAVVVGLALVYRASISPAVTRGERAILVLLGLAALPLFLLVSAIAHDFGGWPRGVKPEGRYVTLALTVAWVVLALAARRTLHRGSPARWHQLWWLLVPLPPVSLFIALVNLVPSRSADGPPPYPSWPFLAGAVAALPLVAYRALASTTATRVERVLLLLSTLSVLPFAVLIGLAWHFMGSLPSGAGPLDWAIFLFLSLGWIVLAGAIRRRLRG